MQPCDWIEHDVNYKYVVDVFGRMDDGASARVRLTGYNPYFYIKYTGSPAQLQTKLEEITGKKLRDMNIKKELKYDILAGYSPDPIPVYKLSFPALWMYKVVQKSAEVLGNIYNAKLPPFVVLFHEMNINPASPFEFTGESTDPDDGELVDEVYSINYKEVKPVSMDIPLLVCAYDLEVYSASGLFPQAALASDEIIQIGMSFRYSNKLLENYKRVVLVSGTCTPAEEYISCKNEKELLRKFEEIIQELNPDVICGYNTYGFDDGYVADRASRHNLSLQFGRIPTLNWSTKTQRVPTEKKTFELASGKFEVRYIEMPGRLSIDLLLSVRREQNLDSYKLDNVAGVFLRDKVQKIEDMTVYTRSTRGLISGNLVCFDIVTNTSNPYQNGEKFEISNLTPKSFTIQKKLELSPAELSKLEWTFTKDDIDAKEIFSSHRGTAEDRSKIAKYCIQDCDLVLTLIAKLETLTNARGMADVCRVPIQYIFLRGQGIKIESAVLYYATKRHQILRKQENFSGDYSYEGAIVLPPKIGMYLDQPIPVLDFNSLYPSNMIAFNLSPDTFAYKKVYNADGRKVSQDGAEIFGEKTDTISYDSGEGRVTCGFVQPNPQKPLTVGILPLTLEILLKKRKDTRKLMETEQDDSRKSVLNGLQLAYKVVANSVYGQCGSSTSSIRKIEVAACTTAAGRERLQFAKMIVETQFDGEIVYGDTDSIFIKFKNKSLAESIELAKECADKITSLCRKPYRIEYEKTFFPFILFCRKRYVGMKYEEDVTKCKRMTMGVALKRRDNAPIVKDIFGGALDILLEQKNIQVAQEFVRTSLVELMKGTAPIEKFIITKQLRDDYKKPEQIAHRVLADRMTERDPGNKPQVGDRLSFAFVDSLKGEKMQGNRIEHLDYIKKHKLKPDVEFYITNQIQNPVAQLFALSIEKLEGYVPKRYDLLYAEQTAKGLTEEEATLKVLEQKEKDLDSIMFMNSPAIKKEKRGPMDKFLKKY